MTLTVDKIEILSCDAAWRNYEFVKLTTSDGAIGWSEFDEGYGAPGVGLAIERLAPRVLGKPVYQHERIFSELYNATRPASGGVMGQALGAIENALLDAKAKHLGVPCYELLGGKVRDRLRVYWSHCPTWRINHPTWYKPSVSSLDDVKAIGREAREIGFTALKTDIFYYPDGTGQPPRGWRPCFNDPFQPELNVERDVLRGFRTHLEALRDGAGPDVDILIDVAFNAKTEGFVKILKEIEALDIFWVELDCFNPKALNYIRNHSRHPIASCETFIGSRAFHPYFDAHAVDVAIVDVPYNGAWQSMKVASLADTYEINIAPHNYYGHLSTMMNAHFGAAIPNFRIMETDVDTIPWENELFTHAPEYIEGHLVVPDRPGWGTEPVEDALLRHPKVRQGGLLAYGKR